MSDHNQQAQNVTGVQYNGPVNHHNYPGQQAPAAPPDLRFSVSKSEGLFSRSVYLTFLGSESNTTDPLGPVDLHLEVYSTAVIGDLVWREQLQGTPHVGKMYEANSTTILPNICRVVLHGNLTYNGRHYAVRYTFMLNPIYFNDEGVRASSECRLIS